MISLAISIVLAGWWLIHWHRQQRTAKKLGMASWYFIIPCLLTAAAAIGMGAYGLGLRSSSRSAPSNVGAFQKWPDPYNPIEISNQTFENQEVVLDGHAYIDCTFRNVTFIYNGTTPLSFRHNSIYGVVKYRSDNMAVDGAIIWMKGFGFLKPDVPLIFHAPGYRVEPPNFVPEVK